MIVPIITPVLNDGSYVRECIESVKGATTSQIGVEHPIIDGGSTDGSVELAEAAGLRVLKERTNIGFQAAKGELIAHGILVPSVIDSVVETDGPSGRRWPIGCVCCIAPSGQSLGNFRVAPHRTTWRIHAAYACTPYFATCGVHEPRLLAGGLGQ